MRNIFRILIVEDLPTDAELCEREIRRVQSPCEFRRVETREDYLAALETFKPHIIVSDFKLPSFDGLSALKLALEHAPETPFLIITGSMNEDTAVECMKAGAWDYVIKEHIKRLGPAVISALEQKKMRQEKRRGEDALLESNERYKALFDRSLDCVYIHDFNGNFIDANPAALALLGYNKKEIQSLNFASLMIEGQLPLVSQTFEELRNTGAQKNISEVRLRDKNGKILDVETKASVIYRDGKPYAIQGIARDITKRRRAEENLLESEERYRSLIESTDDAVCLIDKNLRFLYANEKYLSGHGLTIEKIRGQEYKKQHSAERVAEFSGKLKEVIESGVSITYEHASEIDRKIFLRTVSPVREPQGGEVTKFTVISKDITKLKLTEKVLEKSNEKLRKAILGIVQATALTVEYRDPNTAGHQRRVSELACAIATEMALSTDQIETVYMAGILHDIGKISVPAEILSKPSRLTELEFGLIKSHPQVGYDILKEIMFPWPLAQIILQHHERMDGSGYPLGLSGENIRLEARILAVADTVEAMASHRPYRAAPGIEVALEEIVRNKEVLYDSRVVDACVRLFDEKGFKFSSGREQADFKKHLWISTNLLRSS
ncbi:MAG: PAS domain S-box protein [Candidatus Aminicenantales bacterium]